MTKAASYRLGLVVAVACVASVHAEPFYENESASGMLIFQERADPEGQAMKLATGSRYTHVGIIRGTGGGPYVLEASSEYGVVEISMRDFLAKGVRQSYAIYEVEGVEHDPDWYHPFTLAAHDYLNLPYDAFYRADNGAIYSAQLAYLSVLSTGIEVGRFDEIGDLNFDTPRGRAYLLARWEEHPDCSERRLSMKDCWSLIRKQAIITPASIAADPRLRLVESTFD